VGLIFRKIDPDKDSKYRQWLNSMLVVAILINLINSLFLNWRWLYFTMTIVIGILAILIFKEYKGEK
jgi:fatty acid desaturase